MSISLANIVHGARTIPDDLLRSIFVALTKKPGATESELHRTNRSLSHIKTLLRYFVRTRNKIRPAILEDQYGFMEDKWTRNIILVMRLTAERAIEMQKDTFVSLTILRLSIRLDIRI